MISFTIVLAALGVWNPASCSAQGVDAREMYRLIDTYGRTIRATTFGDPNRMAHTYEDNECYIGVYDRDQKFAKDAAGLLAGKMLMCQVLRRKQGVQISFIDGGCLGRTILPEGAPESQFQPTLDVCGRHLQERLMSGLWQQYVSAKGIAKKGWDEKKTQYVDMQVDPATGRVMTRPGRQPGSLSELRARLLDLGEVYDRFFGRPALEEFTTKTLWAYALGEKTDALEVFKKAPWWSKARPTTQPQTNAPPPMPAQPVPASNTVPLLR